MTIRRLLHLLLLCLAWPAFTVAGQAAHRHWTVAEGLPTGEVQQIVELPNGQMLVNCEGVFCIANGAGFDVVACSEGEAWTLPHYARRYGQLWQGDSLLWLHDFYRLYLFDAHRRRFLPLDAAGSYGQDAEMAGFIGDKTVGATPTPAQQRCIDSLGLARTYTCATTDRQGGLWIGTRSNGIVYLPPRRAMAQLLSGGDPLIGLARSTRDRQGRIWRCRADGAECEWQGQHTLYNKANVSGLPYNRITFVQQLSGGDAAALTDGDRYLLCDSLATLGYFWPVRHTFVSLSAKLPQLQRYRHFVGACPIDERWVAVYAQNGAFLLDTEADTLAALPMAATIEQHARKYNCMVRDSEGTLWVGTQNGLFALRLPAPATEGEAIRVEGLNNNCIRSLVLDARGRLWAGTSGGIARITPTVLNLGAEDGVPQASMMERAACLTAQGRLVFAMGGVAGLSFHPDSIVGSEKPLPVVLTACYVNGRKIALADESTLAYSDNYLAFQFSTLDYAAPSHTRYRYRLLPLETDWNSSGAARGQGTAAYTALPPGSYVLQVQAGPGGRWGDTAQLPFTICPPFWLAWWAKLLYALTLAAIALAALHIYLKRKRMKMERENDERVNRLFELREEARHQFAQSVNIVPEKISANKEEELLVEKLLKAIAQNMDNLDYTVDQMASDVAMSRASFYKKMQAMLGITPNEFLRNVRLKHAARLLAETSEPVNQISLMVGFQTSRYFSQCFRQLFGMTPTEYRSGSEQEKSDN